MDERLKPESLLMVGDTPDPFTVESHLILAVMKIPARDGLGTVLPRKLITDAAQAAETAIEIMLGHHEHTTFLPTGDGA
jgi:hypothetical protein